MAGPSSQGSTSRFVEKSMRNVCDKSSQTVRTRFFKPVEMDKENRVTKDVESSNTIVARSKMRYEQLLISRNNFKSVDDKSLLVGATKKRVDPKEENVFGTKKNINSVQENSFLAKKNINSIGENFFVAKKRVENAEENFFGAKKRVVDVKENYPLPKKRVENVEEKFYGAKKRVQFVADSVVADKYGSELTDEKNGVAQKRAKFRTAEKDGFARSRFKIYDDGQSPGSRETAIEKLEGKFDENLSLARSAIEDRRSTTESRATSRERITPSHALGVPLVPKKVKVEHRRSWMTDGEKPNNFTSSVSQCPTFRLPYSENFIKYELEREKKLSRMAMGLRSKNITDVQRNIILKFLIRLNVHSFYPSLFLHQTVRIFDAVLDSRLIPIEELQLVALASMWIALKREQITYKVPSAEKMLAYSKDLYEGRVDLLLRCERDILRCLKFEIAFPDAFSILSYYITTSKCSLFFRENQIQLAYYCGSYMIDLALFDKGLMKKSTVLLAAAAAEAALFFVTDGEKCGSKPSWMMWRAPDAIFRYSDGEIGAVRSALIDRINESNYRNTDGEIIFKKYSRSRYGKVSQYLCTKVKLFLGVN